MTTITFIAPCKGERGKNKANSVSTTSPQRYIENCIDECAIQSVIFACTEKDMESLTLVDLS
jgi:hypothetical protein